MLLAAREIQVGYQKELSHNKGGASLTCKISILESFQEHVRQTLPWDGFVRNNPAFSMGLDEVKSLPTLYFYDFMV